MPCRFSGVISMGFAHIPCPGAGQILCGTPRIAKNLLPGKAFRRKSCRKKAGRAARPAPQKLRGSPYRRNSVTKRAEMTEKTEMTDGGTVEEYLRKHGLWHRFPGKIVPCCVLLSLFCVSCAPSGLFSGISFGRAPVPERYGMLPDSVQPVWGSSCSRTNNVTGP